MKPNDCTRLRLSYRSNHLSQKAFDRRGHTDVRFQLPREDRSRIVGKPEVIQVGPISNYKSACVCQSIAHEKRVYREQSANLEALLPVSPSLGLHPTLRLMTLHVGPSGWTDSLLLGESLHRGYP
jgi:hypothetical protein